MKPKIRRQLANRKRRIQRRLDKTDRRDRHRPMFTATDTWGYHAHLPHGRGPQEPVGGQGGAGAVR